MGNSGKKERTAEEVAAEFAGASQVANMVPVNDEPEPDRAAAMGQTRTIQPGEFVGDDRIEAPVIGQVPAATMENIMIMLVEGLKQIAAGQANSSQVAKEALDQAARQQQPDNRTSHLISDFNPQGDTHYPRPQLKCAMYLPWEADRESLTFEEIELLNLVEEGEYVVRRNDGVKVSVTVKMSYNLNGKADRLLMNSESAFNDENHWMMPPLVSTLRQILALRPHTKALSSKVLTMDERVDMISRGELQVSTGVR